MNILIYSWYFFPSEMGGLQKYLYNLTYMLKKNHKIVLFLSKENNIKIEGVKVYHIHSLKTKISILNTLSQIISIFILLPIIIIKERINLVSTYVPTLNSSLVLLISKLMGIKNNLNIRGYKPMIHIFRRIFSDIGLFFTQHIFTNSKDLKERYIEQSFLKKSLIQKKNWIFIPNGINPYFWKKGPNFQIKPYDIIFIGKIDTKPRFEAKALDVLYQSIVKIYQEKQIKLKVLVIGAYDKNLIEVKIPNVDFSFFDFKGIILNRKRLRKYYKKSKIFVLSSRHEGMPNTLMEAMATGIPCIASDVGAVSELIDDNINGLIFTKEDIIQLSEYIIKLLENSILREKLGKNAMEKINKSFSWNKIIRKVEKYYKIIL